MKRVIVDSAPLILLTKLGLLDEAQKWFRLVIPQEVAEETTFRRDLPDARVIHEYILKGILHVEKCPKRQAAQLSQKWNLGTGEAAVLVMAIEKKAVVLTDDYAAMRVAKAYQVPFVTTVDVLVELHYKKALNRELARSKLMELQKHAWISPRFIDTALIKIEEEGA